jgi:FkbM family methyltransferase
MQTMSAAQTDFFASLRGLFRKGVRYSTVIDIGCADGQFFLNLSAMGIDSGAVPLNVDVNVLYEESLKSIKDVAGGDYRIAAVTNFEGHLELTTSAHPYWSSVREEGDIYWSRLNRLSGKKVVVPATTLDTLCDRLALRGPFLLKLDVQGAEAQVLEGAAKTLKSTVAVICETDVDDFQAVNAALVANEFILYDITHLNRAADETLGWFYPVYVHRSVDFVLPKNFWDESENQRIVQLQVERRKAILNWNAQQLERLRSKKRPPAPSSAQTPVGASARRNDQCACGSGKKFKHCCGSVRR